MKIFLKNRVNLVWLILMAATGITFWLGEQGVAGGGALAVLLGLAWIKGQLVVSEFMELRHAPPLWRAIVGGWLVLVVALVALAFAI